MSVGRIADSAPSMMFGIDLRTAGLVSAGVAALAVYYFSPGLIMIAAAAVAFVAVVAVKLEIGLGLVLVTAPLYRVPRIFDAQELGLQPVLGDRAVEVSLMEFVVLAAFVAWASRCIVDSDWRDRLGEALTTVLGAPRRYVVNPVTLLVVGVAVSFLAAENTTVALRELRTVIVEPLIFAGLLIWSVRERFQVAGWLDFLVALGLGMSLFSLYHYFFIGVVENTGGVDRVLAIYHSPNALALFLGRILPISFFLLILARSARHWQKALYATTTVALTLVVVLTFSRGAWLGLAAALILVLVIRGHWRWLWASVGAMALAVAGLWAIGGADRIASAITNAQRLNVWQSAVTMIRDHPIAGVGLDNFLYQYRERYILPGALSEPDISHPHNIVLDFWLRAGVLGVVAMAWLQVNFWRRGLRIVRASDPLAAVLALALLAGMTDFLVHGLIDNAFFLVDLAVVFWFSYVLMKRLREETP